MEILYLEDNQDDALLTKRWLKKTNPEISVEVVYTVREAMEHLAAPVKKYDLILTDLNLPDGRGFDLLNHIRANQLPYAVVVVTGQIGEETAIAALKSGADDYISKHEGYLDRLPATLESALSRHREKAALQSRSLRVLYAENNDIDIELTRRHMEQHAAHIRLDFIFTAEQLTARLFKQSLKDEYDVVLLDYLLPGLNALELLKVVFEDRKLDIPVILITGHGSEDILTQATKLGASDYVIKSPGYLNKLPAIIENAFHQAELMRKLEALRNAEERWRILIQQSPAAIYVDAYDEFSSTIFISNQIESICGYSPKEWMDDPQVWVDAIHPDDRESVLRENKRCNQELAPFKMEYRLLHKHGGVAWVRDEGYLIYGPDGKPDHWQGILVNITEGKQAEEALRRRDAIMEAISDASATFLVAPWFENINTVLENMGRAAGVSRAYIFQVYGENERYLGSLSYEWISPNTPSFFGTSELNTFDFNANGFDRWVTLMRDSKPIFGIINSFPEAEQAIFSKHNVRSILCVPIFFKKQWWGFIGFDECEEDREWLPPEIEALRVSASILGAAIQRMDAERALQRQLKELTVLQTITAAGTESITVDELISKATITLSENLYQTNCGILLYEPLREGLVHHPSYHGISQDEIHRVVLNISQGITGRVFRTGKAECVRNVALEPSYVEMEEGVKSEICAPIRSSDRVIGVLNVESKEPDTYTPDDLRLLTTIASQISTAIEKIQLLESERLRLQESETLRQAATVISTSLDLETVLNTILASVKRVVPYDSSSILLIEPDGQSVKIVACEGYKENLAGRVWASLSPILKEIRDVRYAKILPDLQADGRFVKDWGATGEDRENLHGWMGIPLIARDEVIGFLTLDSRVPNVYTNSNAIIAQTLAYHASVAISNAQLYEQTQKRVRELEIINKFSTTLRSSLNTPTLLPSLLDATLSAVSADHGSIWLYDKTKNELQQKVGRGFFENLKVKLRKPGEGLAGHIFQLDRPFTLQPSITRLIPDDQEGSFLHEISGICIPIHTSTESIGLIFTAFNLPRMITGDEIKLLTTFGEMTGNAIHRAELYERTVDQVERLTALREVDKAISSNRTMQETLVVIVEQIKQKLKASATNILLYNPKDGTLKSFYQQGLTCEKLISSTIKLGQPLAGIVAKGSSPLAYPDINAIPNVPACLHDEGVASYFGAPLLIKDNIKGVLEVMMREPFTPDAEWLHFFETMAGQTAIAIENAELVENLQQTNRELVQAYDATLESLGKALELRDQETQGHTMRVTELTIKMAKAMGIEGDALIHVKRGALLHDIGKLGVPDSILLKPGKLTDEEWVIMRKHVDYAYDFLNNIPFLTTAIEIPYCHHEKWDGTGYPQKLKGEGIPLPARIFAMIDVWDALRSDRPYRSAWDKQRVVEYVKGQIGSHFDPAVAAKFLEMVEAGEID